MVVKWLWHMLTQQSKQASNQLTSISVNVLFLKNSVNYYPHFVLPKKETRTIVPFLTEMHITPEEGKRMYQSKQHINSKNKEYPPAA